MKFRMLSILLFTLAICSAANAATLTMTWSGTKSIMPQSLEGSAYAAYNGRVYLFGGFLYDSEQDKTFIYDPSSDSWSAGAALPTARYYCSAAEVGGKIYVIGGGKLQGGASVSLTACEVYDPATNSWSSAAPLPAALRGLSAVSANNRIYVLGGKTSSGFSSAVYEYDPATNTWSSFSTAPFSAAYGGAAFSVSENVIYYIGGITSDTPSSSSYLGKAYAMNASTGAWDSGTVTMPFKTANFSLAHDTSSGKLYVVGGTFYSGEELPYPDIQEFDLNSHLFASGTLAALPGPLSRISNCSAVLNGKMYLLAGTGVNSVDVYTFSGGSWYQPNSPVRYSGEEVYVSGGAGAAIDGDFFIADGGFFLPLTGAVYSYSPSGNNWTKKTAVDPQPRTYSASGEYGGKIVIAGGMDGNANVLGNVAIYDKASDSFSLAPGPDPDKAILSCGAVYNGKLYIFGGRTIPSDDQSLSVRTRIFDIAGGSFTSGPDLPFALEQAGAATIGDKIYIFGGSTLAGPDYMNKNVIIFDPAASSFSLGPQMPYPVYGPSVSAFGTSAIVDSGYYIFYSSRLNGFGGGPLTCVQVYDTQSGSFSTLARPSGRLNHNSAVIGTRLYSTAGEDGYWPSSRLDIADIVSSGCSFTCTASASPESGSKPLEVAFTATASGSGCSGSPAYSWDFGDGSNSTSQNPAHTYENDGTYDWSLTVAWGGQTCEKTGAITVGGCQVSCEASLSATSGYAPLAVNYSASSTATGCSSEVTYSWDFGDGSTSTEQTGTHTYTTPGTYTCTLTATADETDCTKTATITVTEPGSCSVTCEASASPGSGIAPLTVSFSSTATPSNCAGSPSFLWNFGDGSTSTQQNPAHTYAMAGNYGWTLTATVDGKQCSQSGMVVVTTGPDGPTVSSVYKASSPFRLKVIGNDFVSGAQVQVNGVAVPQTKFKSYSFLVAKKGAALKAMCPKGVTVTITVRNPDGSVSNEFNYTR